MVSKRLSFSAWAMAGLMAVASSPALTKVVCLRACLWAMGGFLLLIDGYPFVWCG